MGRSFMRRMTSAIASLHSASEKKPAQPTQNVGLGESDPGPAVAPPPVSRRGPTPLSVAAAKFLKRIMKKYGCPRSAVPHRLCSYPAAMPESGTPIAK
jgi:hypothetical protein